MDIENQLGADGYHINNEGLNENGGLPISSSELAVQSRAYEIWEDEGRLEGKHADHWGQAEREITDRQLSAGDPSPSGP